jgi:hypothetical protein
MIDPHKSTFLDTSFPENGLAIAPDDNADLPVLPLAVRFNSAGSVRLELKNGVPLDLKVLASETLPFRIKRIFATGTTATGITIYW